MRVILIGLVLAGMPAAAGAEVFWGEGCFYRKYTAAHLAAHPRQQVTELAIRLVGASPSRDGTARMDIYARVRPVRGHSFYAQLEEGATARSRLMCNVEAPGMLGNPPAPVTFCAHENSCSLDEWVRLTELDADHAVIEDGSYEGAGSVPFPIGDDGDAYIGDEVECASHNTACNAANPSVRYHMERADPKVCAVIFDDVKPSRGCGS